MWAWIYQVHVHNLRPRQSIYFFNSLDGVAARTLLKNYSDQAKPNPPLKPYGPAEVNT